MSNKIDLQGRIAVVTGGAQGIGYAVASRLAESGATLALWDRDAAVLAEAVKSLGAATKVIPVVVEQSDAASVAAAAWRMRAVKFLRVGDVPPWSGACSAARASLASS